MLKFETTEAIPSGLSCKVIGIVAGAELPFPGQTKCQLKEGAKGGKGLNTYQVGLTVPQGVPKVRQGTSKNDITQNGGGGHSGKNEVILCISM